MAAETPKVKIITLLPSYVNTPMQHQLHDGTDFDWRICMEPEDIADAVAYVIKKANDIETGSQVIIEKQVEKGEVYNPEKLWTYSVASGKMNRVR